jgi:hypothetical protein
VKDYGWRIRSAPPFMVSEVEAQAHHPESIVGSNSLCIFSPCFGGFYLDKS